jgi:foldase protein PrsA
VTALRFLLVPLASLALAGCGAVEEPAQAPAETTIPSTAIAAVDGRPVEKAAYDALLAQARRSYEQQKRPFPKEGSPEFGTLKHQAVAFLVQRVQFELKAEELRIDVSDDQVSGRIAQIKQQYFGGDEKKYEAQLAEQGLTEENVRADVRAQLIQERVFREATADVEVDDEAVAAYYAKHKEEYAEPPSRDVRHILVKTKAEADELYAELRGGADFAELAKEHSEDPGSKAEGGKLTVAKGETVEPFDEVAFALAVDELSEPVKTQFGWHLIQALAPIEPAKTSTLEDVKDSIRQQLLQTRKNDAMTKWLDRTKNELDAKTVYAAGYEPPPDGGLLGTLDERDVETQVTIEGPADD